VCARLCALSRAFASNTTIHNPLKERAGRISVMHRPALFSKHSNQKTIMIAHLDPEPVAIIPSRRSPNLLLHCGAQAVELDAVRKVRTPRSTNTWCPIPHYELVAQVQKTLKTTNLRIGTQAHSLSHEGQRYFGLMEIHAQKSNTDYCWVLGLRNSHDKTFPAGIVAGASVFVCDNLVRREA